MLAFLAISRLAALAAHQRVILLPTLLISAVLAGSLFFGLLSGSGRSQVDNLPGAGTAGAALPVSTITWQPTVIVGSTGLADMAPAVHPTDPLRALVGGPIPMSYTTDGGASWHSASGLNGLDQGVPAWVPGGDGNSAVQVSLSQVSPHSPQANLTPGPTGDALNLARSTDSGVHWSPPVTMTIPGIAENLPHLWADANPSSPYYGRMYLTLTMLDSARTGSFDTVAALYSSDQGATWSTPVGLVDPNEYAQGTNYNAFASAAIQPSGGVVVAWHRGTCCQTITGVPNKVMWSRSTDGGVTFPVSGTIATVPISQSLEYNSEAPATALFRWTPAPNITADPVDGTLYAVWVAYRQPNTPMSAAIYLSRSTDNGASWSSPVVVDNNGPYIYQYLPWVQVSPDHVVHVTYQGALQADLMAHFYVQSTDRGATWSTPFQLGGPGYSYVGQGDFQATSLGGYNGSQGTMLTSWQMLIPDTVRSGTFPLPVGTPSPTPTATCVAVGTPGPWAARANYPLMLTDIAVASDGTTLYAFGGRNGSGRHSQAYKYDYATDSWSAIASFPYDAITEAGAEYGHNGKIYLIWWNGTYIYDIGTNSWSLGAPPPQSEFNFGHAYWNGKIYVIGGYGNYAINAVYAYDIATDSWSTLAPLPQAEGRVASVVINGEIYVANGQTAGLGVTNNLYIYDIATDTWSQGPSSPLASAGPGGTAIGGKLYMSGGNTSNGPTSNSYIYDPATGSWSQGPSLNLARTGGHAATIDTPGGQTAIVVGGMDAPVWFNSVEASSAPLVPCGTSTATATRTPTATATPTPPCGLYWRTVSSPNPGTANALYGVAKVTANDVWAVGQTDGGSLTEHWNGSSWSVVPSPGGPLNGVAAIATNDVWAVGSYNGGTLTEHWNGATWSIVPSPTISGTLYGVAAVATNDVWAVGNYSNGNSPVPVIEHWNGSSWTQVPMSGCCTLYGIAAVAANDVWAVGNTGGPFALTMHWDGSSWSVVPSPRFGYDFLHGVAAVAANDVWAVGDGYPTTLHWNGSTWSVVPSPGGSLYGVAAIAANDVWAVGHYYNSGGTLTQHWDGSSWSIWDSPSGYLYGVAAVATNDVWAVGNNGNSTLVLHYSDPCPGSVTPTITGTSTPTRTRTPAATVPSSTSTAPIQSSTVAPPTSIPTNPSGTPVHPSQTPQLPTGTRTSTAAVVATPTSCAISFSDVPSGSTFYPYIRCLACRGIVNGYPDGTFRPGNNVTRGQISKMVSNAAGFEDAIPAGRQTYEDVPHDNPFWLWIERLTQHGVMSGYACGGAGEPCVPPLNRPYFRWAANATRAQLSKIDSNAAGYQEGHTEQTFEDVPPSHPFYIWVQRLASRGIIGGYQCGGAGEPCVPPQNRPYLRPYSSVTRGQAAKIVSNTFFPECQTPRSEVPAP